MSANSEYAQGLVLINGRAYSVKEVLQALERQAMTSIRIVGNDLRIGKEQVRPLPKISPEQAMKLTCFGSLAYCCDLNRECQLREEAIKLLGMTNEEYHAIQWECHNQFLRQGEKRWPYDQISTSSSDRTHTHQYARDQYQVEPFDPWQDKANAGKYRASLNPSRGSRTSPTGSVDLGGLFDTPQEYSSRSLTEAEAFPSFQRKPDSGTGSFTSEGWFSSSSSSAGTVAADVIAQGFCIYCGQDLREDSEFCSRCGRSQK